MKTNTQRLLAGLVMTILFASCSRPVAYFQKSPREHFTVATTAPVSDGTITHDAVNPTTPVVAAPIPETSPVAQITQANAALDQLDALVRNDSKLAADKTVQKRLNRIKTLLALAPANATATSAPRKANLMERLVLKKMNKKISNQLAPKHPDKVMTNSSLLATGAVLVIIGLLLILLTSGTAATLGVIVLLAGAVILLVGLL